MSTIWRHLISCEDIFFVKIFQIMWREFWKHLKKNDTFFKKKKTKNSFCLRELVWIFPHKFHEDRKKTRRVFFWKIPRSFVWKNCSQDMFCFSSNIYFRNARFVLQFLQLQDICRNSYEAFQGISSRRFSGIPPKVTLSMYFQSLRAILKKLSFYSFKTICSGI